MSSLAVTVYQGRPVCYQQCREFQGILGGGLDFKLVHRALELPELHAILDEIAVNKCMTAAAVVQGPVFVDDAGLAFKALNGLLGPDTKAFIQKNRLGKIE